MSEWCQIKIFIFSKRYIAHKGLKLGVGGLCIINQYCQTTNIRCTLTCNNIVDHSDVVGAPPVGAAPTTSSFSTKHMASMDSSKATVRQDEKQLNFGIWCGLYWRFDMCVSLQSVFVFLPSIVPLLCSPVIVTTCLTISCTLTVIPLCI